MVHLSHHKTRIYLLVCAVLLLTIGGFVYLFFRRPVLLLHVLLEKTHLSSLIEQGRMAAADIHLPSFVVYNLPAALWSTAYILVSEALFLHLPVRQRICWASVVPALGVLSEVLQGAHLLPGHFDWIDLLSYLLPFGVYVAVCCFRTKRYRFFL